MLHFCLRQAPTTVPFVPYNNAASSPEYSESWKRLHSTPRIVVPVVCVLITLLLLMTGIFCCRRRAALQSSQVAALKVSSVPVGMPPSVSVGLPPSNPAEGSLADDVYIYT